MALDSVDSEDVNIYRIVHPYAVVVSQDCDLEWDWHAREAGETGNAAKLMSSVLFCEIQPAIDIRQTPDINNAAWNFIKTNRDIRYQFLQKVESEFDLLNTGLPEMVVDFKRYFTIPIDEAYTRLSISEMQRRCYFNPPYLQELATRFYYYQYRVALPEPHFSEPNM